MAVPGRGGPIAALWAALLAGAGAAGADEPAASGWDDSAAPYLWAARLDGDAKVVGVEADVDVGFKDTLEDLRIAGMAIVEARRDRFGLAVIPLFVRTKGRRRLGAARDRRDDRYRDRGRFGLVSGGGVGDRARRGRTAAHLGRRALSPARA